MARGKRCSICSHREAAAIDLALSRGVGVRAVGRRYSVGVDSVYRHQANHLSPALRAQLIAGPGPDVDLDRLRTGESESLLLHIVGLRQRLFTAYDVAEEHGDSGMAARVAAQLHRNLELTGRLLGDLAVGNSSVTNILIQPAYIELRVALVGALRDFPDARASVAATLHVLESKAAEQVRSESRELAR